MLVSPNVDEKIPEIAENANEADAAAAAAAIDTTATTLNESKDGVETGEDANATPATDSAKKVKKEKSKKRFLSFRSFSFSKKDKQKPAKKDAEEKAAVTNGECEKVPEEVSAASAGSARAEKCIIRFSFNCRFALRRQFSQMKAVGR